MPKTVSATEAKNRLGSLMQWVVEQQDEVIVENHGAPNVVIMTVAEYEKLQALKEKARREEVLREIRALREQVLARNRDLTPEEADELADRFSREFVEDLVKEGKIRFAE